MNTLSRTLLQDNLDQLQPTAHRYSFEFAEKFCSITSASGLETGPYRYDRAPYLRGISEALSPVIQDQRGQWQLNTTQKVVVQKSAQVGVSYCALHWLGCMMVDFPSPMLVVGPSEDYCSRLANLKLKELLTTTAPLRDMVQQSKKARFGQEKLSYYFRNGSLMLVGSNSPADFRQLSARFTLIDDFDGCSDTVGTEGSLEGLIDGRLSSFGSAAKSLYISTPTIKGHSKIESLYESSDQRVWKLPCPRCMAWVPLKWKSIKFVSDNPDVPPSFKCPQCLDHSTEDEIKAAMQGGRWFPTYPGRPTIGFHISSLMCLWVGWATLRDEWLAAQGHPSKLQSFINLRLGETWERVRSMEADASMRDVLRSRTDYDRDSIQDLAFTTCGVDVQQDRLECLVEAWDRVGHSWFINHWVLQGDPSVTEGLSLWSELGERLKSAGVLACAVDSGGLATSAVYDASVLIQDVYGVKCFVVKGSSTPRASFVPEKRNDATTVKAPRSNRRIALYLIDVNRGKEEIFTALKRGARHYHVHTSPDFIGQVFSEERTEKIVAGSVKIQYVKHSERTRNEGLDCSVYSAAAKELLRVTFGFTPEKYTHQGMLAGIRPERRLSLNVPSTKGFF